MGIFYPTKNYRVLFGRAWYIWIPKIFFEVVTDITWRSRLFFIPSDTEKFLEHRYGRDWKIETDREEWINTVPRINMKKHPRPAMRKNEEVEGLIREMGVVLDEK